MCYNQKLQEHGTVKSLMTEPVSFKCFLKTGKADWKFTYLHSHISKKVIAGNEKHTAMYGRQPASLVFAMESTSWPLMPKSHNLMLPVLSSNILDGFTSA